MSKTERLLDHFTPQQLQDKAHSLLRAQQCEECGLGLRGLRLLNKHIRAVKQPNGKYVLKHLCDACKVNLEAQGITL